MLKKHQIRFRIDSNFPWYKSRNRGGHYNKKKKLKTFKSKLEKSKMFKHFGMTNNLAETNKDISTRLKEKSVE